ncbi:hypothetical protein KTO58_19860 [Chitinophaga pendula]|uniref:hypothetical protein n=1 Tax=Chitinophaga TaxID=79328 RepID=UPI000BAFC1C3|nr:MULTISPECIES: hypothetical protein [Chitinophaga]ASZ11075.1 hypothetical protein CK934_08935 [Chitinophaga sp. MD30]UCJ05927.1 hypothetical protein KTO58_19860 [Chitinophaga pendula]
MKLSQTLRRKLAAIATRERILSLLSIDEVEYFSMQFETGLLYLSLIIKDATIRQYIGTSPQYWKWWNNQWLLRDEQLVHRAEFSNYVIDDAGNLCYEQCYYSHYHDAHRLANEIFPNSIVLNDSYAAMVQFLIDDK